MRWARQLKKSVNRWLFQSRMRKEEEAKRTQLIEQARQRAVVRKQMQDTVEFDRMRRQMANAVSKHQDVDDIAWQMRNRKK